MPVLLVRLCVLQFLAMLAHSSEFENVAVREEELPELDALCLHQCPFDVKGGPENKHGKVNILLQVMPYLTSLLIFHQAKLDALSHAAWNILALAGGEVCRKHGSDVQCEPLPCCSFHTLSILISTDILL